MSASNIAEPKTKSSLPGFAHFTKTVHHEPYSKISPLRPELSAQGKNIVVTGGGTGIGKAIAIEFARAGARSISILGRREDRLKTAVEEVSGAAIKTASTVLYSVVDLTKDEEVSKALQSIVARVGKLDILVSNAGDLQKPGPITKYGTEEFMYGFNVNVLTAFNAVQAFLPLSASSPMILNISSGIAHINPLPGLSVHGVSKIAAWKMMDYFAAENPLLHIVNVQPGGVETEMSQKAGSRGGQKDSPELPGQFCVWLASPEAKFLRNKFVWANWDVDEMLQKEEQIKNSTLMTLLLDGLPL